MIKIQELIGCMEKKIQEYRKAERSAWKAKGSLRAAKHQLFPLFEVIRKTVKQEIQSLQSFTSQKVKQLVTFSQQQLYKQRAAFEDETYQLRNEIAHQYKVITLLRKQLQDIMQLMNMQREENHEEKKYNEEVKEPDNHSNTINGLEIIQQEQTDRTIVSNTSYIDEGQSAQKDFIKIQEKSQNSSQHKSQKKAYQNFISQRAELQQDSLWSQKNYDQAILSQASRQPTNQTQYTQQDCSQKWESLPLSVDVQNSRTQLPWIRQLRNITNTTNLAENQNERQSKTKMFLQQFRKTFDKCLSSGNISRKNSKGSVSKGKSKARKDIMATFSKIQTQKSCDSQKLINEMLKDIDNNNKFSVGGRKSELKYQGEKKDSLRCGNGVLYYSNGLCYQGQFKNNLRHGYGVLRFNQIQIYRGEWFADELSGNGKLRNFAVINRKKSQNSSQLSKWVSYCGTFKNNRFEGEGTLYLQGGQKFLGKFICGLACGQGSLYKKNGEVQTGIWRHNQIVQQF